jgi:hypothetical protein
MSLGGAIVLGLFVLFCIGMIYGSLASREKYETSLERIGCAGMFAFFIMLTIVFSTMGDEALMKKLQQIFLMAIVPSIALAAIFRSMEGDGGRWDDVMKNTWKGKVGIFFIFIVIVCLVSYFILGIVLNYFPSSGSPDMPEPYF